MDHMTDTWEEIEDAVNDHDGVIVVTMETLRDMAGYGRLGSAVRQTIIKRLNDIGVKPITNGDLPNDSHANVIIYKEGTPAGEFIDLITSIAQGGRATETTANKLRQLNTESNPLAVRSALESALKMLSA